jgi:hypothetical protein
MNLALDVDQPKHQVWKKHKKSYRRFDRSETKKKDEVSGENDSLYKGLKMFFKN